METIDMYKKLKSTNKRIKLLDKTIIVLKQIEKKLNNLK